MGRNHFLVGSTHRVSFGATEEAEMAEFSKTKKKGKVVEHQGVPAKHVFLKIKKSNPILWYLGIGLKDPKRIFDFDNFQGVHQAVKNLTGIGDPRRGEYKSDIYTEFDIANQNLVSETGKTMAMAWSKSWRGSGGAKNLDGSGNLHQKVPFG